MGPPPSGTGSTPADHRLTLKRTSPSTPAQPGLVLGEGETSARPLEPSTFFLGPILTLWVVPRKFNRTPGPFLLPPPVGQPPGAPRRMLRARGV